jgi:hypothetical protein
MIKVIGVFLFFGSIMALLASISLLFPNTPLINIWTINPSAYKELKPFSQIAGIGFLALAPVLIIAGYGVFKFKGWGLKIAIVIISMNALGDIANMLRGEVLKGLAGAIIASSLLLYLLSTSVRKQFIIADKI